MTVLIQKRQEKLKVILDLLVKPRTLSDFGAWAIIANLSKVPIWVERLTFQAEDYIEQARAVSLDVGLTIDAGKDDRVECHESIYNAFEQLTPGLDVHVGNVEMTAHIRRNGKTIKKRRAYHLFSSRYGVKDVKDAPAKMRRWLERLKFRYRRWRVSRGYPVAKLREILTSGLSHRRTHG